MAIRNIVHIDEEKCDGCGECITACAEGALQLVDGKAKLVSDTYCDGLGACLGDCPQGAISVIQRKADDFDEAAVEEHLAKQKPTGQPLPQMPAAAPSCPGSAMRTFAAKPQGAAKPSANQMPSQLAQWPVQLTLVPPTAPYLQEADLLICADCVPFAVPDFHQRYLAGRAVVVGCPKLDDLQSYFDKLKQIYAQAKPRRITVLKMEVPCCGGIAQAAVMAREQTGLNAPLEVHTIGIQGAISEEHFAPGTPAHAAGN
ncbi:4Fe-4S dicluster domain-containing protein [candidate division GN15 bacterium]|nr:4Fe-4S dicluster domain-containing protein [candidate division GN15 bacterium]